MNPIIRLLKNHRSIRKFKDIPLQQEQIDAIITSGQMASTSSNVQAYSIIAVTDSEKKKELARLAGNQAYVEQAPLFLVFCPDLQRLKIATERNDETFHQNTESFIVATVDAALAAQNAAVAAESLGLGICFIGGIRSNPKEVSELLQLPELVYPLFGMCIGVPDHEPSTRPRMPVQGIMHLNAYKAEQVVENLERYDETMQLYYIERTKGKKQTTWSKEMADKYRTPVRPHIRTFLEGRGFRLD